jgi:hypothetical protein
MKRRYDAVRLDQDSICGRSLPRAQGETIQKERRALAEQAGQEAAVRAAEEARAGLTLREATAKFHLCHPKYLHYLVAETGFPGRLRILR